MPSGSHDDLITFIQLMKSDISCCLLSHFFCLYLNVAVFFIHFHSTNILDVSGAFPRSFILFSSIRSCSIPPHTRFGSFTSFVRCIITHSNHINHFDYLILTWWLYKIQATLHKRANRAIYLRVQHIIRLFERCLREQCFDCNHHHYNITISLLLLWQQCTKTNKLSVIHCFH